jgi:predicted ATPase
VAENLLRATVAARRGDLDAGRAFVTPELAPECSHPMFTPLLVELAQGLAVPGGEDVARDFADRLLQRIEATGEHWMWGEVQRVRGELAEDPATAESLFEAALGAARRQGARTLALRAATSLARRRPTAAKDVLKPLLASFTEGAATHDHRAAHAVLETLGLS